MDISIIQGPFSVAPCQTLKSRFATFSSPYVCRLVEAMGASADEAGALAAVQALQWLTADRQVNSTTHVPQKPYQLSLNFDLAFQIV